MKNEAAFPGWYIELQANVLRQLPRPGEITMKQAEALAKNQGDLKRVLARALLPDQKSKTSTPVPKSPLLTPLAVVTIPALPADYANKAVAYEKGKIHLWNSGNRWDRFREHRVCFDDACNIVEYERPSSETKIQVSKLEWNEVSDDQIIRALTGVPKKADSTRIQLTVGQFIWLINNPVIGEINILDGYGLRCYTTYSWTLSTFERDGDRQLFVDVKKEFKGLSAGLLVFSRFLEVSQDLNVQEVQAA